jgi:hypothetical protein
MEEVIYNLKLNETSKPVQLEDGWYLVKLMGKTVTVVVGDKEKKAVRERVQTSDPKTKGTAADDRIHEFGIEGDPHRCECAIVQTDSAPDLGDGAEQTSVPK